MKGDGVSVSALTVADQAEVMQHPGLSGAVADLLEQLQCVVEVAGGLLVAVLPEMGAGQMPQRHSLSTAITGLACGCAGVTVDRDRLRVVTAVVKVEPHGPGQADGVAGPAVLGRIRRHRD